MSDRVSAVAEATREAVTGTLEAFAPGISEVPAPDVLEPGDDALAGVEVPSVLAHAVPADAVTGPVMLVLTAPGTRRLSAMIGAIDEEEAEFGGD